MYCYIMNISIRKKTKIYEAYQLLSEIYAQNGKTELADKNLSNAEQFKSYRLINIDHKY